MVTTIVPYKIKHSHTIHTRTIYAHLIKCFYEIWCKLTNEHNKCQFIKWSLICCTYPCRVLMFNIRNVHIEMMRVCEFWVCLFDVMCNSKTHSENGAKDIIKMFFVDFAYGWCAVTHCSSHIGHNLFTVASHSTQRNWVEHFIRFLSFFPTSFLRLWWPI